MKWLVLLTTLLFPAFACASISGIDDLTPNIPAETQATIDRAIMTYYQAPSTDKVDTVLDVMNDSKLLQKKTAWPPLVGFLTVIFADNKDHVMTWLARKDYNNYAIDVIIAALMHAKQKDNALTFAEAEQWKPEELEKLRAAEDDIDLKHLEIILPGHIDTLWGAFFASGDPVYVNEIIEELFATSVPYSEKVPAPSQYDVLGENKKLAETTLRQYALDHKVVADAIRKRRAREKDAVKKKILQALLPQAK